jgi:hypothetical protein
VANQAKKCNSMIERKAIFFSKDKLTHLRNEDKILVIFDLEFNRVVGVETIAVKKIDMPMEEFLLYLRRIYINVVYVSTMDGETRNKFIEYGIEVKTAPMLENDKLLNTLYLSTPFF